MRDRGPAQDRAYIPPARGIAAPSSAKHKAPQSASRPPAIQAAMDRAADRVSRATSLATRKTACPMTLPTTTAAADHKPRPRTNSDAPLRAETMDGPEITF